MEIAEALTFDDVLLVPAASSVLPAQANTASRLNTNTLLAWMTALPPCSGWPTMVTPWASMAAVWPWGATAPVATWLPAVL